VGYTLKGDYTLREANLSLLFSAFSTGKSISSQGFHSGKSDETKFNLIQIHKHLISYKQKMDTSPTVHL
jgi:hypothetical protein